MSIESMKEDTVYIEDPQKAKEIQDALNSEESAFVDIKSKEDKGITLESDDGQVIFISEDKIFAIDKYGNVMKYEDGVSHYKYNAPTYDQLYRFYEYWTGFYKDGNYRMLDLCGDGDEFSFNACYERALEYMNKEK